MKSAPWTHHLEVCRESAWRPVVDWMSCGFAKLSRFTQVCKCKFGHLDAAQPHGSKQTTWLTVTNMFSLESMCTQLNSQQPPWTYVPNRGGKTTHEQTDAITRVTLCHFYNSPASYKHHRPEDVKRAEISVTQREKAVFCSFNEICWQEEKRWTPPASPFNVSHCTTLLSANDYSRDK